MNYISEIFSRLDIQQIREFLLHGVECVEISDKTYKQRLDEAGNAAIALIRQKFSDEKDQEEVTEKVYGYASTVEEVYMEIGMQCGANLVAQLVGGMSKGKGGDSCLI